MSAGRQLTYLSSVGVSVQNLDYMGAKYTCFAVTGSSSGTFAYQIEGTLDDISLSSAGTSSAAAQFWFALSSGVHTTNSSLNLFQGPLAAVRVNSSAQSNAVLTLRSLQGIGW